MSNRRAARRTCGATQNSARAKGYKSTLPMGLRTFWCCGFTRGRLGASLGLNHLYVKNDSLCFPTVRVNDRVCVHAILRRRRDSELETYWLFPQPETWHAVAAPRPARGSRLGCLFLRIWASIEDSSTCEKNKKKREEVGAWGEGEERREGGGGRGVERLLSFLKRLVKIRGTTIG